MPAAPPGGQTQEAVPFVSGGVGRKLKLAAYTIGVLALVCMVTVAMLSSGGFNEVPSVYTENLSKPALKDPAKLTSKIQASSVEKPAPSPKAAKVPLAKAQSKLKDAKRNALKQKVKIAHDKALKGAMKSMQHKLKTKLKQSVQHKITLQQQKVELNKEKQEAKLALKAMNKQMKRQLADDQHGIETDLKRTVWTSQNRKRTAAPKPAVSLKRQLAQSYQEIANAKQIGQQVVKGLDKKLRSKMERMKKEEKRSMHRDVSISSMGRYGAAASVVANVNDMVVAGKAQAQGMGEGEGDRDGNGNGGSLLTNEGSINDLNADGMFALLDLS